MFSIIVAIGKNREIGKSNKLLWHMSEDLKNFKKITSGKTVIMGRKTFESIGRPLPNRKNIIVSKTLKNKEFENLNIEIYDDFEKVIKKFKESKEEVFIIGGEEIYKLAMEHTNKLYISHINYSNKEADTYFPKINYKDWEILEEKIFENWEYKVYKRK